MIDILLHELGHHAIDKWYIPGVSPSSEARSIERSADSWSTNAFEQLAIAYPNAGLIDKRNVTGRLFAIEFVFGLARWSSSVKVTAGASHPKHISRIPLDTTDYNCEMNSSVPNGMCNFVRERLQRISTQERLESDYHRRTNQSESFAFYRLGMIHLHQGDLKTGCKLMLKAYNKRAQHYKGWCFEFGHIGSELPRNVAVDTAIRAYRQGAEEGWADSIWGLKRLANSP